MYYTKLAMNNIFICLENIRSLYNIGAIFRTCSFFGIKNVVLMGYSGKTKDTSGKAILHKEILKTSLGSEKDLNITFLENFDDFKKFIEKNNLDVVAIEQSEKGILLKNWKPTQNTAIVLGNEVTGVSSEVLNISQKIVEIPKLDGHNSLNVEVCGGIVLNKIAEFFSPN